jgi:hypothetical protein
VEKFMMKVKRRKRGEKDKDLEFFSPKWMRRISQIPHRMYEMISWENIHFF